MSETITPTEYPEATDTVVHIDITPEVTTPETPTDETTADADKPEQSETEDQAQKDARRIRWLETKVARTAYEAREARRERDLAMARATQPAQQPQPTEQQRPAAVVPAAEVETRAAQLMGEQRFVDQCNEVAEAGAAAYKDFDDAVKNYGMLGEMPRPFLEAVTALGKTDGAKVYYELGKNPEQAERIFQLPPVRMAMELAKLASAPVKAAPVSKAPDPIEPITSARVRVDAEPDPVKESAAWTKWFLKHQRDQR